MTIPKLHYIAEGNSPKELLANIQNACTSGIELVVLGYKDASEKKLLKLAKEAVVITSHYQTRLMIANYYKVAKEVKADGVFFTSTAAFTSAAKQHLSPWQGVGAIAHTLEEANLLLDNAVDYIVLSPFKALEGDDKVAIGLDGYAEMVDALHTSTPLIGYGQITTDAVSAILETGVAGVAVSEAITANFDSIKTFNQLLNASVTQEIRHTFDKK
ncbi:thiamine phosphate synthase [Lacinutrix undariae]